MAHRVPQRFSLTLIGGMSNLRVLIISCLAVLHRRMAVVPPFTGLRRFPEGRDFKQWTGDDSKALMKVGLLDVA